MKQEIRELKINVFDEQSLNFYWPNISDALDTHPEHWEGMTKKFIYSSIVNGNFMLWGLCSDRGVHILILTKIAVYPNGKRTLRILWLYGRDVMKYKSLAEGWLDNTMDVLKCEEVWCELGRPGWKRVLKVLGFEFVSTNMKRRAKPVTRQ